MSATIYNSLKNLNYAVQKLESALENKKASMAAAQRKAAASQSDLFSAPATANAGPINVRMLATRLDTAIDQVEQILKGGRG